MNISGATVEIYSEHGFEAPLALELIWLPRSVGIQTHAWEQIQQDGRDKGPLPKGSLWAYLNPSEL